MFLLRLLGFSPGIWIGVASAIAFVIAGVYGYGLYRERQGAAEIVLKVKERNQERIKEIQDINFRINQTTLSEDAKLLNKLQELDKKWLSTLPQDTPSEPSSAPPQQQ